MLKKSRLKISIAVITGLVLTFWAFLEYDHWKHIGGSSYKYKNYLKLVQGGGAATANFTPPASIRGLYDTEIREHTSTVEHDNNLSINSNEVRLGSIFCKISKGLETKNEEGAKLFYFDTTCKDGLYGKYSSEQYIFIEVATNQAESVIVHELNKKPYYGARVSKEGEFTSYEKHAEYVRLIRERESLLKEYSAKFSEYCKALPLVQRATPILGSGRVEEVCKCGLPLTVTKLTSSELTTALSSKAGAIDPELQKFAYWSQMSIAKCIERSNVPVDQKGLTKDLADVMRSQAQLQEEMRKLK